MAHFLKKKLGHFAETKLLGLNCNFFGDKDFKCQGYFTIKKWASFRMKLNCYKNTIKHEMFNGINGRVSKLKFHGSSPWQGLRKCEWRMLRNTSLGLGIRYMSGSDHC